VPDCSNTGLVEMIAGFVETTVKRARGDGLMVVYGVGSARVAAQVPELVG
jgi:hypothetical protein